MFFNILQSLYKSIYQPIHQNFYKPINRIFYKNVNKFNYNSSLEKRMKRIIEKDNGKKCHCYKPRIVSLKSRTLLNFINNINVIKDKVDLLEIINKMLINVSKKLYLRFYPTMIYTFHNEINLVFFYDENGESMYDGNFNKILTSIVSYTSILFVKELEKNDIFLEFLFDAHLIEFDKDYETLNFLIWRQFECKRNTITLLYKCLHNKNDTNNLSLDDMKYSLPVLSQELFIGNILKKRKILKENENENENDNKEKENENKENENENDNKENVIKKLRKDICVEYFYFHKDFKNVFEEYIKTNVKQV
jgi:hypothetical protein